MLTFPETLVLSALPAESQSGGVRETADPEPSLFMLSSILLPP